MQRDLTMREALVISAGMMLGLSTLGPWGVPLGYVLGELANRVARKVRP
jgi:hypothetical protein